MSHVAVGIAWLCAKNAASNGGWSDCSEAAQSSFVDVSPDLCVSIASSGMSALRGLISLPFVASCNNASAAWCLIPLRCTKSKSNCDSR